MKQWTIGRRLATGFATLVLVLLCFGAMVWFQMRNVARTVDDMVVQAVPEVMLADQLSYGVALLRIVNFKHMLYDAQRRKELEVEAREQEALVSSQVTALKAHFSSPAQQELFSKVPELWQAYVGETWKLREANSRNDLEAANKFLLSAGKIGNELIGAVDACQKSSADELSSGGKEIKGITEAAKRGVFGASAVVLILATTVAIFITKSVATVLRRLVSELNSGAEQTAAAAGQVSSASQSLAGGATEQAASLEETSASLEEMASMTRRNAEHARTATELVKQTCAAADKGVEEMRTMISAMDAIKASGSETSKIIRAIDEIAFQTNILALNAAVEAARAGGAGRGFAVVADEVRNLAQRCAEAAKETSAKIEESQVRSAQGMEISGRVGAALAEITTRVREVDNLVGQVATASREQTLGITQINTAVGQMDSVTQGNAASAEESAAAAEELNAQAVIMKHTVAELLVLVDNKPQRKGSGPTAPAAGGGWRQPNPSGRTSKRKTSRPEGVEQSRTATASRPVEPHFSDF